MTAGVIVTAATVTAATVTAAADAVASEPWSGMELAVRLGAPALVLLLGATLFLWGRSARRNIMRDAADRDGVAVAEAEVGVRSATQRVLAGLLLMLLGSVVLVSLTFWRVLS